MDCITGINSKFNKQNKGISKIEMPLFLDIIANRIGKAANPRQLRE